MTVVDDIKERIDVVDLVGDTIELRKAGRTFKALCPFHAERTPSFVVDPNRQTWHCFGACSEGGDIFSWIMKSENTTFREALRILADRAGISLQVSNAKNSNTEKQLIRLRSINEAAALYYRNLLIDDPSADKAREYITGRGVSAAIAEQFRIGYAPTESDALQSYLGARGFSTDDLIAVGLVMKTENGRVDRFRDRLLFPITDNRGDCVGFGGRSLSSGGAKYLNTAKTQIFDKGRLLYGLTESRDTIRRLDQIIIVEGYMDVIAAHQHGQLNAVASMGTALTEHQIKVIKPLTRNIVLALDSDTAGAAATIRGIGTTHEAMGTEAIPIPNARGLVRMQDDLAADIRILEVPKGRDPDEIIRMNPELWANLVKEAPSYLDYRFNRAKNDYDLKDPRSRGGFMDELLPLVQAIVQPVVKAEYIERLAVLAQVDAAVVRSQLKSGRPKEVRGLPLRENLTPDKTQERLNIDPQTEFLLKLVMARPEVILEISSQSMSLVDDAAARELLEKCLEHGKKNEMTPDLLIATLDERLQTYVKQLINEAAALPPFSSNEAREAARQILERLRERRLRAAAQAQHQDIAEHERKFGAERLDDAVQLVGEQGDSSDVSELMDPALAILRSQETGLALHTGYHNASVSDEHDKQQSHESQNQPSFLESETEKNTQEVQL